MENLNDSSIEFDNKKFELLNPPPTEQLNSETNKINSLQPQKLKRKRIQAQRACTNCKKLHSRCDNQRPCKRCFQSGFEATCADLPRKRRMSKSYSEQVNNVWESTLNVAPRNFVPNLSTLWTQYQINQEPLITTSNEILGPFHEIQNYTNNKIVDYEENPKNYSPFTFTNSNPTYTPNLESCDNTPKLMRKSSENQSLLMENFLYHQMEELKERNPNSIQNNFINESVFNGEDKILETDNKLIWHSLLPQDYAISVWKSTSTPGFNFLVECNQRFIDLVGYPIEQLKNNFPCQKLFISKKFGEFSKRTQIGTAFGFKEVYLSIFPLITDNDLNKHFIVSMLEIRLT